MPKLSFIFKDLSVTETVNVHKKVSNYIKDNNLKTYSTKDINYNSLLKNDESLKKEFNGLLDHFESNFLQNIFAVRYLNCYSEFFFKKQPDTSKMDYKTFLLFENLTEDYQTCPPEENLPHYVFIEQLLKGLKRTFLNSKKNSKNIKDLLSYFILLDIGSPFPKEEITEAEWLKTKLENLSYINIAVANTSESTEDKQQRKVSSLQVQNEELRKNLQNIKAEFKLLKKDSKNTEKNEETNKSYADKFNALKKQIEAKTEEFNKLEGLYSIAVSKVDSLSADVQSYQKYNLELKNQLNITNQLLSDSRTKIKEHESATLPSSAQATEENIHDSGLAISTPIDEYTSKKSITGDDSYEIEGATNTHPPEGAKTLSTPQTTLFEKFLSHSLDFLVKENESLPPSITKFLNLHDIEKNNESIKITDSEGTFQDSSVQFRLTNKARIEGNPNFNKIGPAKQEDSFITLFNKRVNNIPPFIYIESNQLIQVDEFYNFIQSFPCFENSNFNSLTRYCYFKGTKFFNAANKEIQPVALPNRAWGDGQVIVLDSKERYIRTVNRQHFDFESMIATALNNNFQVLVARTSTNDNELEYFDIRTDEKVSKKPFNPFSYEPQNDSVILAKGNKIEKIITSSFSYRNTSYYRNHAFATVFEISYDVVYAEKQNGDVVEVKFDFHSNHNPRTIVSEGDVIKLDEYNNFIYKESTKAFSIQESNKKIKKLSKPNPDNTLELPEVTQSALIIGNVKYQHNYINTLRLHGIETTVINGYDNYSSVKKMSDKSSVIVVDPSFISHDNMYRLKDDYKTSNKKIIYTTGNGPNFICNLLKEAAII